MKVKENKLLLWQWLTTIDRPHITQ